MTSNEKICNWVVVWRFFLLFLSRRRHASWSLSKRIFVSWRFFLLLHSWRRRASWFLNKRIFVCFLEELQFDDLILITRVLRRAICFKAKDLIKCELISQNSKREICCVEDVKMISSSSLLIERLRVEDKIVTNWQRFCFFLLVDRHNNECEVYIARHDENQI